MRRALALLIALAAGLHAACDQDLSFGTGGVRTYTNPSGGANAIGTDLLVLSDGRLLVAGSGERPGGDRDAVWWGLDSSGNQVASGGLHSMAGGVDEDFYAAAQASIGGPVYLAGSAVAASGATLTVVARLSFPALTLDTTFGTNGWITRTGGSSTCGLVVDSSGRPCLAEGQTLTRFLATGAPDTSFGSSGTFAFSAAGLAMDMALDSAGRFVISGSSSGGTTLWRVLATAAMDNSFGTGGVWAAIYGSFGISQESLAALAIAADDSVAAVGMIFTPPSTSQAQMFKYHPATNSADHAGGASVSSFFGQEGAFGVVLNGDGSALICGKTVSGVVTYPSLWSLSPGWNPDIFFSPSGQRTLSSTPGSMTRMRRSSRLSGYITGQAGSSMGLWKFNGCDSVDTTPIPILPSGASSTRPVAFPQPAKDKLTIAFESPESAEVELRIFDESGRLKGMQRPYVGAGTANLEVETKDYAPGIYIYTLQLKLAAGTRYLGPAKFAVRP